MNSTIKLIVVVFVLLAVLVGGLMFAKNKGLIGQEQSTKVAIEEVKHRSITELVTANGKIYPEIELSISPDVSGELIQLPIIEGDSVKIGQLLARIEPELIEAAVSRSRAAVNSTKANAANAAARIVQLQTQQDALERELGRTKQLFDNDIVSSQQFEEAQTSLLAMKAEIVAAERLLEAANYNVHSAEASYKEAKDNLGRTSIYSPMTGVVSSLQVEKGERVVGTSQFAGTELMRIANFESMELRVEVSENDVLKVSPGDTAKIEIDAYPERVFMGKVNRIFNVSGNQLAALANDQVTNYTVSIRIDKSSYADLLGNGKSLPFRPGMSASADIVTRVLKNVITVPIISVTTRELPDSLQTEEVESEEVVFVLVEGKAEQVAVQTGLQDSKYIELTAGLKGGESVVSGPYREISKNLESGSRLKVVDKDELYSSK